MSNRTLYHLESRVQADRRTFYSLESAGLCKNRVTATTMAHFYIAEDFPIIEEQQRKQPSPDKKPAKQLQERNKKVTMRGNKLLLDGKVFTCNDIERGPTSNQPVKLDGRSNNDALVFGGSTSSHYGLSNLCGTIE